MWSAVGLLRPSASVGRTWRARTVRHLTLWVLLRWLAVWCAVRSLRSALRRHRLARVLVATHLAASMLRNVGHYLHATRHDTLRTTVAEGVCGSCWTTEPVAQLLDERAADVISSNVHGVSNTENNKGALGR